MLVHSYIDSSDQFEQCTGQSITSQRHQVSLQSTFARSNMASIITMHGIDSAKSLYKMDIQSAPQTRTKLMIHAVQL